MKIDRKYLILIALAGAVVAIDQATKLYVHTHFRLGESITVIQDYFNLTYVRNMGAAFGIFASPPEFLSGLADTWDVFRKIFFLSVPPIALIVIMTLLHRTPSKDKLQVVSLSIVFGGAIGNYIDRIQYGYVIDFLDFHIGNWYTWPAFNVADSAIVIGVGLMGLIMFQQYREEKAQNQVSPRGKAKEGA